ncbi:MAG: permease-like cell division protein FtsX [Clostridia bacterium]|nr:permease-like cell division protein FtsX [Clostridia bacterium]
MSKKVKKGAAFDDKPIAPKRKSGRKESGNYGYLTKQGFQSLVTHKLMSIASIAVLASCLMMIGFAILIFANINSMIGKIESENVIMVFIQDGSSAEQKDVLRQKLESTDKVSRVEYIPKEISFKKQVESLGKDAAVLNGLEKNPLPDAYKVTLKDMKNFDDVVAKIKTYPYIINVRENGNLAKKLSKVRTSVTIICIAIILMLLAVSMFIISNTIQVAIYSRRREISIMKAVGATNNFVRWPFMVEGFAIGIISSAIATLIVMGIYAIFTNAVGSGFLMFSTSVLPVLPFIAPIIILFLFIGIMAGVVGSAVSLKKYLKEEGSVLYEN